MSMVERVARAICNSKTCEGFMCCENPAQMGRRHDCPVKKGYYTDAARAAIEAMREPTEAMEEAADDPVHSELAKQGQFSIENYGKLAFASYPFSVAVWQAMIDKALSEEEERG